MYSWVVWLLIVFHQTSSLGVESFSIHSQFIVVYVYHLSISLSFGRSYRLFHGNGLIDRGRWDSRLLLRQTSKAIEVPACRYYADTNLIYTKEDGKLKVTDKQS